MYTKYHNIWSIGVCIDTQNNNNDTILMTNEGPGYAKVSSISGFLLLAYDTDADVVYTSDISAQTL